MTYVPGGTQTNRITGLTTGDDTNVPYGKQHWLAQTFTLTAPTIVWRCRFLSWTSDPDKAWLYKLFPTTAAGKPTWPVIDLATLSSEGEATREPAKWRVFDFPDYDVLAPGTYAITAQVVHADSLVTHNIRADATDPDYPGGKLWRSMDNGVTWTEIPGTIAMFEVWGWEPPPDPPPTPTPSNWAPVDIDEVSLLDGFRIVVTTDIPVHLFMRWSLEPPLKHKVAQFRRGIALPFATKYCFVAWKENEQLEPGDTYIHTFEKRNWPICETRYFYFYGTKQTEASPSASPIFSLHREQEYIPTEWGWHVNTLHNRTIQGNNVAWPVAHDAPAGNVGPWHDAPTFYIVVGARQTATFWIERGFLRFDTSDIPPGSVITAATLRLWILGWLMSSSVAYPHVCITAGVQSDPIIATDYGDQLPITTVGGQVRLDDLAPNTWAEIALNAHGLILITQGGTTKLCLRQEMDVIDAVPPLGSNHAWFHSFQGPGVYRPQLNVWYIPP